MTLDIQKKMIQDAKLVNNIGKLSEDGLKNLTKLTKTSTSIDMQIIKKQQMIYHSSWQEDNRVYHKIEYPFGEIKDGFIVITQDLTQNYNMLNNIFKDLFVFTMGGLILVIIYSVTISRVLTTPVAKFAKNISKTDINNIQKLQKSELPLEFHPIVNSLNNLTNRIKSHIKYQKELFIGITHELKTPLAVMKLKNEITIRKPRDEARYKQAINLNIEQINKLNKIISSMLDMGRQEGAKFEKETTFDIVTFLQDICKSFSLIGKSSQIKVLFKSDISSLFITTQATLYGQIVQNFVQNAIKFSPKGENIVVKLTQQNSKTVVSIIDRGIGIDKDVDIFAPFKRYGEKQGVGLGLFLAKNASSTIGAKISITNNKTKGATATVIL